MKYKSRVWLPLLLLTIVCALIPTGKLGAQPAAATPASATALDELTGPIALYPDAIVIHILTAAQNYDTLKLFSGWLEKNANLKGGELQRRKLVFPKPWSPWRCFRKSSRPWCRNRIGPRRWARR